MPSPDPVLDDALVSAHSILSLLVHRGLVDSNWNRQDVAEACEKLSPYAKAASDRIMAAKNG